MEPWTTAITDSDDTHVWYRGHDVSDLMRQATFADVVYLLHQGRLPSAAERRLIDAMLIAVADHGPGAPSAAAMRLVATGNRQAPEAAMAAGILAVGDLHGGAGYACLTLITRGIGEARAAETGFDDVARKLVAEVRENGQRIPGFGHRTHSADPRTEALFALAKEGNLAGDGVRFVEALSRAIADLIKPMPMNIDGAMAGVLYDLNFQPVIGKLIFIMARVAGLSAQLVEEYTRERPMRIRIPVSYQGPPPRAESSR